MLRFQRRGEPAAFDSIVSMFLAPALAVARQILSDRAQAEDAVQEAFLRVVRNRDRYLASKAFSTWFYAILRNVCRDMLRARGRHAQMLLEIAERAPADFRPPPSPDSESGLAASRILNTLPARERSVLTLRILHDLPLADVAAALGISHEAAKKRAQRGLRRLRARESRTARSAGMPPFAEPREPDERSARA